MHRGDAERAEKRPRIQPTPKATADKLGADEERNETTKDAKEQTKKYDRGLRGCRRMEEDQIGTTKDAK